MILTKCRTGSVSGDKCCYNWFVCTHRSDNGGDGVSGDNYGDQSCDGAWPTVSVTVAVTTSVTAGFGFRSCLLSNVCSGEFFCL